MIGLELILIPLFVAIICMRCFMFNRTDNVSGKIVAWQETQFKRVFLPVFINDIQANKTSHGESNVRRVKFFVFVVITASMLSLSIWYLPSFWLSLTEETGLYSRVSLIAAVYLSFEIQNREIV